MNCFILRKAEADDCDDLFAWRNDLLMRKMAHNMQEVSRDTHNEWFAASLQTQNRLVLIGVDVAERKIGVVRYDFHSFKEAIVALNIAPEFRGQGYGADLLKQSENFLSRDIQKLHAEIKSVNIASIKTFENAGYVFDKELDGIRTYLKILTYNA